MIKFTRDEIEMFRFAVDSEQKVMKTRQTKLRSELFSSLQVRNDKLILKLAKEVPDLTRDDVEFLARVIEEEDQRMSHYQEKINHDMFIRLKKRNSTALSKLQSLRSSQMSG